MSLKGVPNEPADVVSMKKVAEMVGAINSNADTRTAYAPADREALDRLRMTAGRVQSVPEPGNWNEQLRDIRATVAKYLSILEGVTKIVVADEEITSPAIESGVVRLHAKKLGEMILETIAGYIEDRQQNLTQHAHLRSREEDALAAALKVPLLADALRLFEELHARLTAEHSDGVPLRSCTTSATELIRGLMNCSSISSQLPDGTRGDSLLDVIRRQQRERAA